MRVAVLGPVRIAGRDGGLVEPPGLMGKRLVASLVLAGGESSVGALIEDLWPDGGARHERAALQSVVSRVRALAVDGLIISTPSGYRLCAAGDAADLALARRSATESATLPDATQRAAAAESALGLWRGDVGFDLGESELATRLAAATARIHDDLRSVRARALLDAGRAHEAIEDAAALAAARPLDEDRALLQMRALAACGRRGEALAAFADLRARLRDELGANPAAALLELNTSLLEEQRPAPPLRIGLRAAGTPLLGRENDLSALQSLMAQHRLVTILGAGGLGKTRLAQELAGRSSASTVVVELAGVRVGSDIELAFASTLEVGEVAGARLRSTDPSVRRDVRARILAALALRPTLLVVDNCEHIIDAAALWIDRLLTDIPTVRILATSRAPLLLASEHVYPLGPLHAADDGAPGAAVDLFVARARAARPAAALPIPTIMRLCQRLDGLPLAIELAAARVRTMSLEEIERRIDDRFALLTSGDRAAPERHRTRLAVIDWSWNLLDGAQRALLRRLSRFPDGFSVRAAELMLAPEEEAHAVDLLAALVNQSLVAVEEVAEDGRLRYRMLETVREFGDVERAKAGEEECVGEALYRWAVELCLWALPRLHGAGQVDAIRAIRADQDNLVSVLRHAVDANRADVVAPVFAVLAYQWELRGAHSEAASFTPLVLPVLRQFEPPPAVFDATVLALAIATVTALPQGVRSVATARAALKRVMASGCVTAAPLRLLSTAVRAATSVRSFATCLRGVPDDGSPVTGAFLELFSANVAENAGESDAALQHADRAYALAVTANDVWLAGTSALLIAQQRSQRGDGESALEWAARAEESLRALHADDDLRQLDWLIALAQIRAGHLDQAADVFARLAHAAPDPRFTNGELPAVGLAGLAEVELARDNTMEALDLYRQALAHYGHASVRASPWFVIIASAFLMAAARGAPAEANAEHAAAAVRQYVRVASRLRPLDLDKPVIGSALVGISVWHAHRASSAGEGRTVELSLALFALASAMGARQDLPSTDLARARVELAAAHGDAALDKAEEEALALASPDERARRALEILAGHAFRM